MLFNYIQSKLKYYLFAVTPFCLLICACGGGGDASSDANSGTGSLGLQLTWEDQTHHRDAVGPLSPSDDVCVDYNIDTIAITVRDSSGTEVASASPTCDAHRSVISGVPAGTGITVSVVGMVAGSPDWRGEATGITLARGEENNLAKISMQYVGADTTAPTVSTPQPVAGATDVVLNPLIKATFSESVVNAFVNASSCLVIQSGTSSPVACTVGYDTPSMAAIITPDTLLPDTEYTVTITTAVQDMAEIPMAADYSWTFTTGTDQGNELPQVADTTPAADATGVDVHTVIGASFTKAMAPSTINDTTFSVNDGTSNIAGTISYSGLTATFTPTAALAYETLYSVTIAAGVQDLAGDQMASDHTWSFTTSLNLPPQVVANHPVDGATGVDPGAVAISVTFSEAMDPATLNNTTFLVNDGNGNVAGTVSYANSIATFRPDSALASSTLHTVTITSEVQDLAGNSMLNDHDWSFTTERFFELVKGISSGVNQGSYPHNPVGVDTVVVNGLVFFAAQNTHEWNISEYVGEELWVTDGTEAGTKHVKDINPGVIGSNPRTLIDVNGTLYFTAEHETYGRELWRSSGSDDSTVLVEDINPDSPYTSPLHLTNVDGVLFFTADDGINGRELWRSSGTASNTYIVHDIASGTEGSDPDNLISFNDNLYFSADDGVNGDELWYSNGYSAHMVEDSRVGAEGSNPHNFAVSNGKLFYSAFDDATTYELWVYDPNDPVDSTPHMVMDICPGDCRSYPEDLIDLGGVLMFEAYDGTNGYELWRSDGTDSGTYMVKNINPSTTNSRYIQNPIVIDGIMYFSAEDGTYGQELWRSNGTDAGTYMIEDINPDSVGSYPAYLTEVNGTLFFTADDGTGKELWKSNGTAASTTKVKDISPDNPNYNIGYLAAIGDRLFFAADDSINGTEPWTSDGTEDGTTMLKNIVTSAHAPNINNEFEVLNNTTLYFAADDGSSGLELWASDGTTAGTRLVKDIVSGSSSSSIYQLTASGNKVFFRANTEFTGYELWASDGTDSGTSVIDICPGTCSSYPLYMADYNDAIYFRADDGTNGTELWTSTGTQAGTTMVKDLNPTGAGSPSDLTSVNGLLYFFAYDGANSEKMLWRSDGTSSNTFFITDFGEYAYPSFMATAGSTLFLAINDDYDQFDLWTSDGTIDGTQQITELSGIYTEEIISDPLDLNGRLFFTESYVEFEYLNANLWTSDGTAGGTSMLKTMCPNSAFVDHYGVDTYEFHSYFDRFSIVFNNLVFFAGYDDESTGVELYASDGTPGGTVLIKDINPSGSSFPSHFGVMGDKLFFSADDGANGLELWITDGTSDGTQLYKDINPIGHAYPHSVVEMNGALYFRAWDSTNGHALWKTVP